MSNQNDRPWEQYTSMIIADAIDPKVAGTDSLFRNDIPREANILPFSGGILNGVNDLLCDAVAQKNNWGRENRWLTSEDIERLSEKYPGVGTRHGEKPVKIAVNNKYHSVTADNPLRTDIGPDNTGYVSIYNAKQLTGLPDVERSKELEAFLIEKRSAVRSNVKENLRGEWDNQPAFVGMTVANEFVESSIKKGRPQPVLTNLTEAVAAYCYAKNAGVALRNDFDGEGIAQDMRDFTPGVALKAAHFGAVGAAQLQNKSQQLENGPVREAVSISTSRRDLEMEPDRGGMEL